ncbi:hypothetical protein Syun_005323 [Stephania yunnanensis]|uniref:DNA-directed RNA polymerase subunit n=1 Tax=Stephania yunnanensis TaxID=152371 RepID=A0AAP0L4W1_9MAGN
MEGLKVSNANLVVYLHPSKITRVRESVLRELSALLFKYNERFDGVVLAHEVISQSKSAKILPGVHPYFGVRLQAKLLLFSPKPQTLVEGKVVKLGKESIHVIVLGFSAAAITEEDIRKEFRYSSKHGEDVFASSSHKRHVIKVGSMIRLSVKRFDEEALHISGSLLPANTGCIKWLEKHNDDDSQLERIAKKRRHETDKHEPEHTDEGAHQNTPSLPKKSKRLRTD